MTVTEYKLKKNPFLGDRLDFIHYNLFKSNYILTVIYILFNASIIQYSLKCFTDENNNVALEPNLNFCWETKFHERSFIIILIGMSILALYIYANFYRWVTHKI